MECEEVVRTFPSSFRLVPHNVSGIPATLWLTMWPECEEFVSLNEDAYCYSLKFELEWSETESRMKVEDEPDTVNKMDSSCAHPIFNIL